ncbi:MAG: hypothetical protein KC589_00390 [Nanoarchaeota archaeon]|nr:hypothetical protein [Nanoarchaeota archaeon]
MAEVANSKAYLSYDDRTMSIKVNKFERNYSEKSHFIVTKKLRDYLDEAISSQIPNLGSVFKMEVSNSGYYVYARPTAEQMNKVNSFGKQLKDQEEVKEHILLNQKSGNQYFDDEGNVLSKDDYLTYKGQNIQSVDISTLSKETQKVFGFLKENFHRIANNLDIFNDQDIWDEIVGKTKWKNSGGIFTIHDETGQLGIFLNPKKQNPETFPHELLHAFTEIILNDPQTKKEHDFVNLVNDLYEEFKNTPNSKNLNRGYQYKDISEFLVYSLTNTEMQEFIKNNENKKISNLYEKVISFFKKLFGLNDSQFEKLFKSLKLAINDSDYNNIKERSLSVLKSIKGQEIYNNAPMIEPGVSELFESNEEFANQIYEALGFNNLRKEYSNVIIDQVWKRLASEGITNADSLIGTRETINNKDFNKFWSAVKDVDIQNVINFFELQKQKALDSYSKYKGEFDPTTGTFTSNDTSFFDKKIEDLETILQQKQQAQQQYSQYLDTIFPDSKVEEIDNSLYISVLNQLEQENIIEKDCTGGKLKAEKGLQTNFTKGGEWKIIKDLKGYPTHKEGGVDLTIGKNGVSIKNGNTEFTAKHGLVLPNNFGNPIEFEAMSKVLSQRNKHLNWVDRGLNPDKYPKIDNQDGTFSTHRLAYSTGDNGEAYVYPTIIQNDKGELEQLDDNAAWEYARETKTAMRIPNVKLAEYYSQNGLIKH